MVNVGKLLLWMQMIMKKLALISWQKLSVMKSYHMIQMTSINSPYEKKLTSWHKRTTLQITLHYRFRALHFIWRLSEWIDLFLKAAAQKFPLYVQGTSSFFNKTKKLKFKGNILIAALDVESLYPNIDHEECTKVCKYDLNQRNNQCIATKVLKLLILLILRMSTMMFCGRYSHQSKGTTMGTPMAVNYANCFMGHFETNLLQVCKKN